MHLSFVRYVSIYDHKSFLHIHRPSKLTLSNINSRSTNLDEWKKNEIRLMEIGGNKRAREFFSQHGGIQAGKFSDAVYNSRVAELYRNKMRGEVEGTQAKYDRVISYSDQN